MRIFFISSWWPTDVHPTHGNFVQKHARLIGKNHEIYVIAVQEDQNLKAGQLKLATQITASYCAFVVYYGTFLRRFIFLNYIFRAIAYCHGLRSARKSSVYPPDLIHGNILIDGGIVAAFLGMLYSVPFVIAEHASHWNTSPPKSGLKFALAKWAGRKAAFILPVSSNLGQNMAHKHFITGRYYQVSNVVDDSLFYFVPSTYHQNQMLQLIHVSNFDRRFKNLPGLLRAYAKVKRDFPQRFHLTIAGDGDFNQLGCWIRESGLDFNDLTVSGPHSEEEIAALMQGSHALILFSDIENQPVVLLEAQCCGLPCIASNVGGVEDIVVQGKTGFLVERGDEIQLIEAMLKMHRYYSEFNKQFISKRAKRLYGKAAVMSQLEYVYKEI